MNDLFDGLQPNGTRVEPIADGATLLHGFALEKATAVLDAISSIDAQAPFRQMITPGGYTMAVAMTNCGSMGWVTDRSGYRYDAIDPKSGQPWPVMPNAWIKLARNAARAGGFLDFVPDACLINRYQPGVRLSLHQDKDEHDFTQPVVSVSLGLPAIFQFGGLKRADRPQRLRLTHGDVVVWGGLSRLAFHGIAPLAKGEHPLTGPHRFNLTFRKAR